MLHLALQDVSKRYAGIPRLHIELQAQIWESMHECTERLRSPLELLLIRLRMERLAFDAYNRHRLGESANLLVSGKGLGDDIDEDLESFPFRCEVVLNGFEDLTLDLMPIYSSEECSMNYIEALQSYPTEYTETPLLNFVEPSVRARSNMKITANVAKTSNKRAPSRHVKNYDKLQDAPPANMNFPRGNITLAELAAFHPKSISSWDIIERFCNNGGSASAFKTLINHFREMDFGPIKSNTILKTMKNSMNRRAKEEPKYQNWSASTHNNFEKRKDFDPASISVTGFRRPAIGKNRSIALGIPIKDMAKGVKIFPTEDDALDLTNAIQYCQAHPNEPWMFPDDFERLVEKLGPVHVTTAHQDAAVLARYTTHQIAVGVRNAALRTRDWHGRLQKVRCDAKHNVEPDTIESKDEDNFEYDANISSNGKKRKRQHDSGFNTISDKDLESIFHKPLQKRKKINRNSQPSRKKTESTSISQLRLWKPFDDSDGFVTDDESYKDVKQVKTSKILSKSRRSKRVITTTRQPSIGTIWDQVYGMRFCPVEE